MKIKDEAISIKEYDGAVPPCGIYCGGCPRYKSDGKKSCMGCDDGCQLKKCKSFYVCCREKKGLSYCYECKSFPCSRFKKFAKTWEQYGQDLIDNQKLLKKSGVDGFIEYFNEQVEE